MNKISFLVGLKNNLDYSCFFYENFRKLFPEAELVFVSYGSTDGTHTWLQSLRDSFLKIFISDESKTLSDTYNKAIQLADKEYVAFLHNDMVAGKFFIKELEEAIELENNALVYYKILEPLLFADDKKDWKLNSDLGIGKEDFNIKDFFEFEEKYLKTQIPPLLETKETSFFLCIKKNTLLEVGGLDPLFSPMFCEDDDIILRLKLYGFKILIAQRALVYHFISKTSRFSEEYAHQTQAIEENAQRNFCRKWGFPPGSPYKQKRDIGIVLKNGSEQLLKTLEPFASIVYTDFPADKYIAEEQLKTKINLRQRILNLSERKAHDVVIEINGAEIKDSITNFTKELPHIIHEKIKNRKFKKTFLEKLLRRFDKYPMITVFQDHSFEHTLIKKDLS